MPGRKPSPRTRGDAQARARKAFARRQRSRRLLSWRRIALALAFVLLIGLGVYALYFSSWLRADGVELTGNDLLTEKAVLATAEVPTGGPLVQVDLEAIEKRIRSLATVKSVDVSRKWPHQVRIEIVEQVPIAVLDRGTRKQALAADGTPFPVPARALKGLPRVKVGASANRDALQEGAAVVAALDPDVAALVEYAEVRTVDEIQLHLRDGRLVRWGSADQSADKAAVLLELLSRKARFYDVSVPGSPTTR